MKIFICYRRSDTRHVAGRVGAELRRLKGGPRVFVDVTTLRAGREFAEDIGTAIRQADAVIVLIGPNWLPERLEEPTDFVRREVDMALTHCDQVIPVLVDDASMPSRDTLPKALQPLCDRHAQRIRHDAFERDFEHLAATLVPSASVRPFLPSPLAYAAAGLVASVGFVLLVGLGHWASMEQAMDQTIGNAATTAFLAGTMGLGFVGPLLLRLRSQARS